ncbi:hypothetical protein ACVOMV_17940 [Mesorhizobium atlanticum]
MRKQILAPPDFEAVARSDLRAETVGFMKEAPDQYPSFGQLYLPKDDVSGPDDAIAQC